MRIAVSFLYVLFTLIYLVYGGNTMIWGAFNICTHIGFVGYLCYLLKDMRVFREEERLFFTYLMWLSVANCIYILFCVIRGTSFAVYNTDIFAYITGIGFVVFLAHCALNKR